MAASTTQVAEALADILNAIPTLGAKPFLDTTITPNEAQIFTRAFDPRDTFSGPQRRMPFVARVYTGIGDQQSAHEALRGFMDQAGSTSVLEAVNNEDNWDDGLGVHYAVVTQIGEPSIFTIGTGANAPAYLGVEFDIEITF